ncbi:MAG: hypothetical protein LBU51_08785 [Bacteroidales bacterium]|jgi:hypothetical protein|nr:hypothetical protein [Bacteroidales bacterium]
MIIKRLTKSNLVILLGLLFTVLFVVSKSCLSPFASGAIDYDTSVYLTIARGITEGKVPFRDFFDNKGPLTYLISAPGMLLGGLTGVWIIEFIFMCISVFFAYKTALFFGEKFSAFVGVLCSFLVFSNFFYEVAGTEEYSLAFMMISLYIFTKYYFTKNEAKIFELVILGLCFASSILIRINMFPLWLGFCLILTIKMIAKHKISSLLKYITFFCIGIIIIIIPVMLYLYLNNALTDFIVQNLASGSSRAFQGFSLKEMIKSFFIIIEKKYCFLPLLIGSLWIIKNIHTEYIWFYVSYTISFILTVLFHAVIRTNFDHYNMVLVPFLVPVFVFCITYLYKYLSSVKYKKIAVLLMVFILFAMPVLKTIDDIFDFLKNKEHEREYLIAMGKEIDKNTGDGDTIISLGFNCNPYLFTNRKSASKFIYQTSGVNYYPEAQQKFLNDISKKPPAIIVIRKNEEQRYDYLPVWYKPIYDMIDKDYYKLDIVGNYVLFIKNKA